jgi:hypothetical protein
LFDYLKNKINGKSGFFLRGIIYRRFQIMRYTLMVKI